MQYQFKPIFHKLCVESLCMLMVGIRPLLGPARCRYPTGCTTFTLHRLRTTAFVAALRDATRRLYSCSTYTPLQSDLFE